MTLRGAILMSAMVATVTGGVAPMAFAAGDKPPPLPFGMQESAEWYIAVDGEVVGPLTETAMQKKLADGTVKDETPVWRAGMAAWVRASESEGVRALKIEARLRNPQKYPPRTDPLFIAVVNPRF